MVMDRSVVRTFTTGYDELFHDCKKFCPFMTVCLNKCILITCACYLYYMELHFSHLISFPCNLGSTGRICTLLLILFLFIGPPPPHTRTAWSSYLFMHKKQDNCKSLLQHFSYFQCCIESFKIRAKEWQFQRSYNNCWNLRWWWRCNPTLVTLFDQWKFMLHTCKCLIKFHSSK
jgi:hypothetical protein